MVNRLAFKYILVLMVLASALTSCNDHAKTEQHSSSQTLFQKVSSDHSNITFANQLTETDTFNYFNYPYIYMGGGVAVADFNNDELPDIYFTGNMVENKLYLNKGGLKFEDISQASGTVGDGSWMHGITICDINNDGWKDIYISISGRQGQCRNQLFVNQGVNDQGIPVFKEEAAKYGIDDPGHSTQATFFDYDNDGDQDLYVANYPITDFKTPSFYYSEMIKHPKMDLSDHLYRNNGDGSFTNVTEEAGLLSFGLSLSATISDLNNDGYKDIYVSNDFASPDFCYINNGDGTFSNKSKEVTRQTSYYGMGADIADFNNDGFMDILQVDMTPEGHRRNKENMAGMNIEGFYELVDLGLHHQYMYNSLQMSRGVDDNGDPQYSNIAKLAGVSSTDWSWSPLFADFDNDGLKDIFISNGTRRDINNNDFFKKLDAEREVYFKASTQKRQSKELENVQKMPSEPIANYVFKNNGDLTFSKQMEEWGLTDKGFSNGAVYADLDNDGDLELIVNNIDEEAYIYKNNTSEQGANYLKVNFKGAKHNSLGIGTKVMVYHAGQVQVGELTLTRGYQSSVEPILYFGLGENTQVDSLIVNWPDGRVQMKKAAGSNQIITFDYSQAEKSDQKSATKNHLFAKVESELPVHKENMFNDFDVQVLLPHKMSNFGPALAVADIDNDGLDDYYIGAASGENGAIYKQKADGKLERIDFQIDEDKKYEDLGASFFDADGDGDADLYIVSGGYEFQNKAYYQDRLFINERGKFIKAELPKITGSGSCVRPYDYDGDGDLDLFVGGRLSPGHYPYPGVSYLLRNDTKNGSPKFEIVTDQVMPGASNLGMVTDALWSDFNNDGKTDLLIVGEWMELKVYLNNGSKFEDKSSDYFDQNMHGWWFSIDGADFDHDGDTDYVLGNLGKNYKYQAHEGKPFKVYASDFDHNDKSDIVLSYQNSGEEYPVRGRGCSSQQIPTIKAKYKDYKSFSKANVVDIYGDKELENSLHYSVESFASIYLENTGKGYKIHHLPNEAQLAPINDMVIADWNNDGHEDIIIAGNLFSSEVETPRADAGIGLCLLGDGKGHFQPLTYQQSGIFMPYDVKQLQATVINGKKGFVAVSNQGPVSTYTSQINAK
ncbi:FG-GAP-like repeat-containing protein [Fulvivirga ligni]|uniref:FG-GAP-like repeat-containing protein n=1 Tax=Fulvivirga ligni TaxID=2904246 RepID=UPI001F2B2F56|nr:FG-GAP-like repeat-containing protein [Fulvivirga ligni]UII19899.1 VCBS repeat-containing protein [Fulvivirga ligni]